MPARLKELRETCHLRDNRFIAGDDSGTAEGKRGTREPWAVIDKMTNDQPQVSKLRRDSSRPAQKRGLKPDRPHLPATLLTPLQDHGLAVSNPLLRLSHPAAPRSLSARTAPPGPLQLLTGCRRSQEWEMRPIRAFQTSSAEFPFLTGKGHRLPSPSAPHSPRMATCSPTRKLSAPLPPGFPGGPVE